MSVTIQLDGRPVEASDGASITTAARAAGVEIPTLCEMSEHVNGVCRICMVEVGPSGRMVPACATRVSAGLEVRTTSPAVQAVRRGIIDLLLADHAPHEGADVERCKVDRYAREFGLDPTRYRGSRARVDLSHPAIRFDPSLCILCRRCLVACDDDQLNDVIALSGRGQTTTIAFDLNVPMGESSCTSCGACVDACPTGALIEKGWVPAEQVVPTTCPYCGVGCTVEYGVANGKIVWARGAESGAVNRGKLCVKGKFAFEHEHSPDRLTVPLIRRDGVPHGPLLGRGVDEVFRTATWDEALDRIAEAFQRIRSESGPMALGGIACDRGTNEGVYAFQRMMRAAVGTDNVDQSSTLCHAPSASSLSYALGAGAATNPLQDVLNARTILLVGSNTERAHPVASAYLKRAARDSAQLIVIDPRRLEIARYASMMLPLTPGTDVFLFSAIARVIVENGWHDRTFIAERTEGFDEWSEGLAPFSLDRAEAVTGIPRTEIVRVARAYALDKPSVIFWCLGATEHANGTENIASMVNLALLTGNLGRPGTGVNPLRGQNNVQGGADMGSGAGAFSNYRSFQDPELRKEFEERWKVTLPAASGWKSTEMIEQARRRVIRGMYISGENSVRTHSDSGGVAEALTRLDFLVVGDLFLTETAEFADVVLPAASSFEQVGTFTNTERRVQMVHPVVAPLGEAKPDWWIHQEIGRRMGYDMGYQNASDVMDEIAATTPTYAGLSHARLETGPVQWPGPEPGTAGTVILHQRGIMRGKGRFRVVGWRPEDEVVASQYPYRLLTGRDREHYHTATMTGRSPTVLAISRGPAIEMNPNDLAAEGFTDGDRIVVASPNGSLEATVRTSPALPRGIVWTTFHYPELRANVLTPARFDPITHTPGFKDARVRLSKPDEEPLL